MAAWFIAAFEPIADEENDLVSDAVFSKLSGAERRRVYFAFWNYLYLQIVISQSTPERLICYDESPECEKKKRESQLRVMSPSTAALIEKKEQEPELEKELTKAQLFSYLSSMENVFNEAFPVLQSKKLEKTPEFGYWIKLFEDDWNLNYLVKDGRADKTQRGSDGRILIRKGEPIFGVETPLMIRVDFVKRGRGFKVFNLGPGDGD